MANLFAGKLLFKYSVGAQIQGEHIFNQASTGVLKIDDGYICPKNETNIFGTDYASKKIIKPLIKIFAKF